MAITICSSPSSHSPTIPNLHLPSLQSKPSLKSPYSLQPPLPLISSTSPKFNSSFVSDNNNALVIAAATEVMVLASAAAQAARDVESLATAIGEVACGKESFDGLGRDKEDVVGVNRKKRSKRRTKRNGLEMEEKGNFKDDQVVIFRDAKSGCLKIWVFKRKRRSRLFSVRQGILSSSSMSRA